MDNLWGIFGILGLPLAYILVGTKMWRIGGVVLLNRVG
jgi:hypothetical protein